LIRSELAVDDWDGSSLSSGEARAMAMSQENRREVSSTAARYPQADRFFVMERCEVEELRACLGFLPRR